MTIFSSEEDKVKREPPKLDLNLSHKKESTKPIPKELITKFILEGVDDVCKTLNLEHKHMKSEDKTHIVSIFTNNLSRSEKAIEILLHKVAFDLGPFLERETNEDRRTFFRSITLFESTVEDNVAIIRWI